MNTSTITSENQRQEWLRLPQSGKRCPVSGLSRATLNRLILPSAANGHCPPVHSVVLKQRWAVRGIRMIHRQSLLDHIDSFTANPMSSAKALTAQGDIKSNCEAEPDAPDRLLLPPLSLAAKKTAREFLRKLRRNGGKA